jgi:hypothetical protein
MARVVWQASDRESAFASPGSFTPDTLRALPVKGLRAELANHGAGR